MSAVDSILHGLATRAAKRDTADVEQRRDAQLELATAVHASVWHGEEFDVETLMVIAVRAAGSEDAGSDLVASMAKRAADALAVVHDGQAASNRIADLEADLARCKTALTKVEDALIELTTPNAGRAGASRAVRLEKAKEMLGVIPASMTSRLLGAQRNLRDADAKLRAARDAEVRGEQASILGLRSWA